MEKISYDGLQLGVDEIEKLSYLYHMFIRVCMIDKVRFPTTLLNIFFPIFQFVNYGIECSYIRHSMLDFKKHLIIHIYKKRR